MSEKQPHLRIYNWDELQHYKDRDPPWIKLYNRLLDNHRWGRLPDASKGHYTGLLMLASRTGNEIPLDVDWIAGRIAAKEKLDLRPLVNAGLIELYHHDRQPLAQGDSSSQAFARSREERRAEERQSREREENNTPQGGGKDKLPMGNWTTAFVPIITEAMWLGPEPPPDAPPNWSLAAELKTIKGWLEDGRSDIEVEDLLLGACVKRDRGELGGVERDEGITCARLRYESPYDVVDKWTKFPAEMHRFQGDKIGNYELDGAGDPESRGGGMERLKVSA